MVVFLFSFIFPLVMLDMSERMLFYEKGLSKTQFYK